MEYKEIPGETTAAAASGTSLDNKKQKIIFGIVVGALFVIAIALSLIFGLGKHSTGGVVGGSGLDFLLSSVDNLGSHGAATRGGCCDSCSSLYTGVQLFSYDDKYGLCSCIKTKPGVVPATTESERSFAGVCEEITTEDTNTLKECKNGNLRRSGVAFVKIGAASVPIWCVIPKDGGPAWIVIQRRGQFGNKPEMFTDKRWKDYRNYFGDPEKEYWIGLENMSKLTSKGHWELDIELTSWKDDSYDAFYSRFAVMEEYTNYQLRLGSFQASKSTLGDAHFENSNKKSFTTRDMDNDLNSDNCATFGGSHGGWWYSSCSFSSLNGINRKTARSQGIRWCYGENDKYECERSWKDSFMKIRQI